MLELQIFFYKLLMWWVVISKKKFDVNDEIKCKQIKVYYHNSL